MYNIEEIIAEKYLDGSLEAEKYLELIEAASEQDDTSKEDSDKDNEEIKKRKKKVMLIKAAAIAAAAAAIAAPVYIKNRNDRELKKIKKDRERLSKFNDEIDNAMKNLDLKNNASVAKF
jgi:hypothetical protein